MLLWVQMVWIIEKDGFHKASMPEEDKTKVHSPKCSRGHFMDLALNSYLGKI
ncbi:hypothetical protein DMR_36920 [Solidesulfovibrio magneticus RS-1]|uniref:Uncharacterized protein n=1 Tax=Solidesulfovibrio magneticus (strain ATCC 700980 / DSM 13731 / RS-1) TaxID=573370 RepID=C4XM55_SOLM1|nr:hypothetical protein DMR_36920 [Solidesulfovibrio magneticus RS-1]